LKEHNPLGESISGNVELCVDSERVTPKRCTDLPDCSAIDVLDVKLVSCYNDLGAVSLECKSGLSDCSISVEDVSILLPADQTYEAVAAASPTPISYVYRRSPQEFNPEEILSLGPEPLDPTVIVDPLPPTDGSLTSCTDDDTLESLTCSAAVSGYSCEVEVAPPVDTYSYYDAAYATDSDAFAYATDSYAFSAVTSYSSASSAPSATPSFI
jgi:hypothetical protein